eukprot:TRINITY_DN23246_c0_g1_i1.p1 TRINITY_DN23246_c0_g1~~TRINITY_DN23246_c0_g1_i1.p1  ORF type:complete len:289 (+),score=113.85 TRINITY_DN23246_c0_g1_i1:75-869(+)
MAQQHADPGAAPAAGPSPEAVPQLRPRRGARGGVLAPTRETLTPTLRAQLIAREYELIAVAVNQSMRGVYIQPSKCDAFREWTGAVFIRQMECCFSPGLFKFLVHFPEAYPFDAPAVKFVTPVFHPAVGLDGSVDLGKWFESLTPFRDNIALELLQALKALFFKNELRDRPLNKEANAAIVRGDFEQKAKECARLSEQRVHNVSARHPTAIRFTEVPAEFAELVAKELDELEKESEQTGVKANTSEWFQCNLLKLNSAMMRSGD